MNNSKTVQSQLEITKEQTPKMIEWIKVNKECIEDSDSKSDAEKCMDESNELAKKLGLNDFYIEHPCKHSMLRYSSMYKKFIFKHIKHLRLFKKFPMFYH